MQKITRFTKTFLIAALFSFAACEQDPVDPATDFSGTWNCAEQSTLYGSQSFQIQVTNDLVLQGRVFMANFYNLGSSEKAVVDLLGFDVDIPSQTIAGRSLVGGGSIMTSKRIEMDYVISDGIDADTVSAILTR